MTAKEFHSLFIKHKQQFSTDTRNIQSGDIFFALKGDNFNGNLYAIQALKEGAAYVVIDEVITVESNTDKIIQVSDVLQFMQSLATYHRQQFDIPIIAIAGSNGKTTTKELLISVLSQKFNVHATKGNFNNHIGVPITLLSMPLDTDIGLIEIGTNNFGEIAFLSELLEPNFGIITNIGKEHLEGFGDVEGVAREESELYHYLRTRNGFTFVNSDDSYLNRMAHRLYKKLTYSINDKEADVYAQIIEVAPELELLYSGTCIHAHLSGKHNGQNVVAALAIGNYFGLTAKELQQGILTYRSTNNRSEIRDIGTNHFMLDAYNANPSSMMAALETFKALRADNKVVLLGDMFEIGENALEEHRAILDFALEINCTVLLAGHQFSKVANDDTMHAFSTTDELVQHLSQKSFKNTWFLVKGSRGMRMEAVLDAFVK
jgi:UDP-N-acetylmuramoyl-tripeptide--D-alanyl-D-alanine ligase